MCNMGLLGFPDMGDLLGVGPCLKGV